MPDLFILIYILLDDYSEEALGFMCGMDVPDKDGVSAAAHLAELCVHLEKTRTSLTEHLHGLYLK